MIKKLGALLVVFSIFCSFPCALAENEKITYYVSPNGNDSNDGLTEETALATLDGARLKVQSVLSENLPVDVIFKEGTYRFNKKIDFGSADSGSNGAEVTYKGADGEKVIFKASKELNTDNFRKVTDSGVLDRLPESAKENVYMLDLKNEGISYLSKYTPAVDYQIEDINFYFNGVEQRPAEWPNGEGNYTTFSDIVSAGGSGKTGAGGTFKYTDSNPDRWTTATDYYLEGYFGNDFRCERVSVGSVDAGKKEITLATGTDFTIKSTGSKRYKAINLLEELDVPGEWYVDRDKLILYYYPMGTLENSTLEINNSGITLLNISNASYINFENIDFTQIRGVTLQALNSESIDVRNCNFKYVGWGIYFIGNQNGTVDNDGANHYKNIINGVNNSIIENNTFIFTAKPAVHVTGGNRDTLAPSGNIIRNNYFYKCANIQRSLPMAWIRYGCGDVFENNIMHNSAFHALNYNGNDMLIQNNEIYNANREASDVGMIYTGRSFTERGSIVKNNYLHDGNPVDERVTESNNAIYFDDTINGQTAEGNIIENTHRGVTSNGMQDNSIINNTFINCDYAYHANDSFLSNDSTETLQSGGYATVVNNTNYTNKYKNMANLRSKYKGKPYYNTITGNTLYNSGSFISNSIKGWTTLLAGYNTVSDNNTVNSKPTVDLSGIGLTTETPDGIYSDFNQVYPKDDSYVASEAIEFMWENSVGADKYRVVVARDEEFSEIVYDVTVDYNYCTLDGFSENSGEYYWKVYAINNSNQLENTWESEKTLSFTKVKPKNEVARSLVKTEYNKKALNCNSVMFIKFGGWVYQAGNTQYNYVHAARWAHVCIEKETMREFLSSDGMLTSEKTGVEYDFSKVMLENQNLSAKVTDSNAYTVDMNDLEYSSINFVATTRGKAGIQDDWARYDTPDYKVKVNYTDGTSEEVSLTIYGFKTVNDSVIASPKTVEATGKYTYADQMFNLFEYVVPVKADKKVSSFTFNANQTPISLFALTGVIKEPNHEKIITSFDISENCNSIATATSKRYGAKTELDRFEDAYQFDETEMLRRMDNNYQVYSDEFIYSLKPILNEKRAISQNEPVTIYTSDESYCKIGFAAANYKQSGVISDYPVTLKYTDGTVEEKIVKIGANNESTLGCVDLMGNFKARKSTDGTISVSARMYSCEVDVNGDKLLESVTFGKVGYENNRIFIFAVSGIGKDSFELYDFKIQDNYGAKLDNVSGYEDEKVTISFLTKSYEPYQFILSEYNGNVFDNMDIFECDGGITKVSMDYNVPTGDITKIKGFLWEFDNLKALYDIQTIK